MPCKQCGWCCKNMSEIRQTSPSLDEFMLARGWHRMQVSKDGKLTQWVIAHRCPHLTLDNKCRRYKVRPLACQLYPSTMALEQMGFDPQVGIGRKCGFRWNGKGYE